MAGGRAGMTQERLRLQLRVVQTVFRAEIRRLERTPASPEREEKTLDLRSRSMALLEAVRAELDGSAAWHDVMSSLLREVEEGLRSADGSDGGSS
jgi:hypothetical protein